MARRKHWSEIYQCSCGKRFSNYAAEAFHRHNFPIFCKKKKAKKSQKAVDVSDKPANMGV